MHYQDILVFDIMQNWFFKSNYSMYFGYSSCNEKDLKFISDPNLLICLMYIILIPNVIEQSPIKNQYTSIICFNIAVV